MKYLFLIKADGFGSQHKVAKISSELFHAEIIAASSTEVLVEQCSKAVLNGVQIIELCGGFSDQDAEEIQSTVADKCAVGRVIFGERELAVLERLGFSQ